MIATVLIVFTIKGIIVMVIIRIIVTISGKSGKRKMMKGKDR